jgi:hypothetical protein
MHKEERMVGQSGQATAGGRKQPNVDVCGVRAAGVYSTANLADKMAR